MAVAKYGPLGVDVVVELVDVSVVLVVVVTVVVNTPMGQNS